MPWRAPIVFIKCGRRNWSYRHERLFLSEPLPSCMEPYRGLRLHFFKSVYSYDTEGGREWSSTEKLGYILNDLKDSLRGIFHLEVYDV